MVKKLYTWQVFILWMLIVPAGFVYIFHQSPPPEVNVSYFISFLLLGSLAVFLSFSIKIRPVSILLWVTIPAFLIYGLFVEMVLMQLLLMVFIVYRKSKKTRMYEFFIYSTIVFILSVCSAASFLTVSGSIQTYSILSLLIGAIVYQFVHGAGYLVFNALIQRLRMERVHFSLHEQFSMYSKLLVVVPLALSLYYLLLIAGGYAFLLLGIPFLFITVLSYSSSQKERNNRYLKMTGEIGQKLSSHVNEESIITDFTHEISALFKADYAMLFDYKDEWLTLLCCKENGQIVQRDMLPLKTGQGIAGKVLMKNKPLLYNDRDEWNYFAVNRAPADMTSLLGIPVSRNQETTAVLLLSSKKKGAFSDFHVQFADLLCSYFSIAIEKAQYIKDAIQKNEHCALTNLYNYKYLDKQLGKEMQRLQTGEINEVAAVLLDIDYFKKVNDNYGHQGGNDVLKQLAEILSEQLPEGCTAGRYGGEEFLFIMPSWNKEDAAAFAEDIRRKIQDHSFIISSDLQKQHNVTAITITLSMGVSAVPEDTDEQTGLLRNADRALYIGAKQAGRNKVATYVK